MAQEVALPDWARSGPSQAFAGLGAQDDSLGAGIGSSYGVVGYKGKTWSLRYRGERKIVLNPADGAPSSYLDVIILSSAAQKSKSYYKDFVQGQDGERPVCASINGVKPDNDVTQKQCDNCALCPRNEWKTDPKTGRKGRDCTDYKRLAVLILPTQTTPLLGNPLIEPVFLRVPPDSLSSLAVMGETMEKQGFHYSTYVTRITFDPNKAHPSMMFRPLQKLSDGEAPVILELRRDPGVERIVGGKSTIGHAPGEGSTLAPPNTHTTGLPAPQQSAPVQGTVQQAQVQPAIVVAPPPTAVVAASPVVQTGAAPAPINTGLVRTGLGAAAPVTAAQPASTPITVADVGAPEESDAAMDARIAALIGKH